MLRHVKFGARVQEPVAYASAAILLAVVALGTMAAIPAKLLMRHYFAGTLITKIAGVP
jgi:hypothetical protein